MDVGLLVEVKNEVVTRSGLFSNRSGGVRCGIAMPRGDRGCVGAIITFTGNENKEVCTRKASFEKARSLF